MVEAFSVGDKISGWYLWLGGWVVGWLGGWVVFMIVDGLMAVVA